MVSWIIFTFSAAAIGVFHIATEYFGSGETFLQISSTNTILAPISTVFLIDTVSVYMVIAYMIIGSIACLYGV
jgi:formate hydrogenlyase subunit 3/multisubunit Na+/H+ antiporter MnhD subunit